MCRRGIENRGSAAYRSAVVARIRRGKCLRIAALGGSITCGVNLCGHRDGGHAPGACGHDEDVRKNERLDGAHGKKDAWPVWLERFLNHRMPCAGGTHTVVNLAVSGKGTNFWTDKLEMFKPQLAGVDMIILDAASNDVSELIGDTKATSHEWESGLLPASMIQRYTELFIRKVTAEFPEVALVWATVGWRGMGPRSKAPYHHDADSEHDDVLRYYDRDHISLLAALRPFHTKAMRSWEADTLFVDGFHLSLLGHKMVAQLVGNWLVEIGGGRNRRGHHPLCRGDDGQRRATTLPVSRRRFSSYETPCLGNRLRGNKGTAPGRFKYGGVGVVCLPERQTGVGGREHLCFYFKHHHHKLEGYCHTSRNGCFCVFVAFLRALWKSGSVDA